MSTAATAARSTSASRSRSRRSPSWRRAAINSPRPRPVRLPRGRGGDPSITVRTEQVAFSIAGFHVTGAVVVLGAITGMVYGVSAVGLVLVYRSSKLINFAHGQMGTLGAAVLGLGA